MEIDKNMIKSDFYNIFNKTNFNDSGMINLMFKNIFENIYGRSYVDSKNYLFILMTVLIACSIIGTIANSFVIFVFCFIFNKEFYRKIQSKLVVSTILNNNASNRRKSKDDEERKKMIDVYENLSDLRNKLILKPDLKLFYSLIRYLAVIDILTCSLAIPTTIYEIWNNMKINNFYCKLFEFMRSFGVVASNFVIILIATERLIVLYKPKNFQKYYSNIRIVIATLISIGISILCMLQVSVYQRANHAIIYIGICLKSENTFKQKSSQIIYRFITFMFIINCLFVTLIYVLIFTKTFNIHKKQKLRKNKEFLLVSKVLNENLETLETKNSISRQTIDMIEACAMCETKRNRSSTQNKHIIFSIIIVALIYNLSIIPWCLTINGVIQYNPYIQYTTFLNSISNPIIYGFLNSSFRNCGIHLLKLCFSSVKKKLCSFVFSR